MGADPRPKKRKAEEPRSRRDGLPSTRWALAQRETASPGENIRALRIYRKPNSASTPEPRHGDEHPQSRRLRVHPPARGGNTSTRSPSRRTAPRLTATPLTSVTTTSSMGIPRLSLSVSSVDPSGRLNVPSGPAASRRSLSSPYSRTRTLINAQSPTPNGSHRITVFLAAIQTYPLENHLLYEDSESPCESY